MLPQMELLILLNWKRKMLNFYNNFECFVNHVLFGGNFKLNIFIQ